MEEERKFTLDEAHLYFAQTLNGKTWELLAASERSRQENELMLFYAYASCYHWLWVGTGLNHQRAQWLIARVYAELGFAEAALRHASRCLELTQEHADLMEDFDRAYAYEGMARVNALTRNEAPARQYIALAQEAAQKIQNEEDRSIFLGDFNGGEWYGLK